MKLLKLGMRFWITLGSVFSFLFGWAVFSHSLKPAQPVKVEAVQLPTLEPLPPMNGSDSGGFQPQQPSFSRPFVNPGPFFMTGGS